ncbi:MAG: GGDEF domain-containing protein [Ruminiclostridium sp.]
MLINQLLELYNGLLTAMIVCYMIYRLNIDLKRASTLNYFFSGLVITLTIFLLHLMFHDMIRIVMLMSHILIVTFIIKVFHNYSLYYSVLTAVFATIFLGFAEIFVVLAYVLPLKLTLQEYKENILHISVGSALIFIFIYFLLKFISNYFIKARKRIHKKYNKLTILLSANLITVFTILLFVYSIFDFYLDYKIISNNHNKMYFHVVFITIILLVSIFGTIYIINNYILNSLRYNKLKRIHVMDTMTDTLNRGSGLRFLEDQLEICKKLNKDLTICYIDINDLKVINDMMGHREGDQLIKAIVGAVNENIRETDVISRLGGDEFVIILPDCNLEYGKKLMEKISEKVKNLKIFKSDEYDCSISYGLSEYGGNYMITVEGLLEQADHQMYLNKRAIKSTV